MPYKSYKKKHILLIGKAHGIVMFKSCKTNILARCLNLWIHLNYIYKSLICQIHQWIQVACFACFDLHLVFVNKPFAYFTPNSNYSQAHSHSLDQCFFWIIYLFILHRFLKKTVLDGLNDHFMILFCSSNILIWYFHRAHPPSKE
jgi:hypothetical protein